MHHDLSSGLSQSDLTIDYRHNEKGVGAGFQKKDIQVFVGEVICTFLLCFIVAASKYTGNNGSTIFAQTIGLIAIIYTFAPISGAQLNPSVTLGLYLRGKMNLFQAAYSVTAECLGGLLAGSLTYLMYGGDWDAVGYPDIPDTNRRAAAFCTEVICVFFLLTGVFNSATTKVQRNNSYYGVAIGFIVMTNAMVAAPVSGACFNPAVAMLTLLHGKFMNMWVYILGPCTGSVLAWLFFHVTNPAENSQHRPAEHRSISKSVDYIISRMSIPPISDGKFAHVMSMLGMEFIGTFMITWVVALSNNVIESDRCIAIGTAVCSMVYIGGAVSGGHNNPCVTLGVYLRGRLENSQSMRARDAVGYCCSQVLGAVLAGAAAGYVNDGYSNLASPSVNTGQHTYLEALIAEFIFAAFLVLAVLSAGTSEKVAGNSYFGLSIGFVVLSGVVIVGDIVPGSCFNPAVTLSLPLLVNRHIDDVWVYLLGDILGAFFAFLLYAFWRDLLQKPVASSPSQPYFGRGEAASVEDGADSVKSPLLR